ncbi:MAG: 8-oxo-dGTP diphosphatase MutT [Verrucomicrobiales bacterium]
MKQNNSESKTKVTGAIEVAAGLVFRRGKLLLAQRRDGDHLGGLWEFPGGKLEQGESCEECLQRELREELGIEVEVGELLNEVIHCYPEKTVHLKFFRCSWKANEPQPIQCQNLTWVSRKELKNYAFPAADAQLIQELQNSGDLWS